MLELVYTFCYTLKALPQLWYIGKTIFKSGHYFFLFRSEIMKYKVDYIWVYKYIFLNPPDTHLRKSISLKKYQNS